LKQNLNRVRDVYDKIVNEGISANDPLVSELLPDVKAGANKTAPDGPAPEGVDPELWKFMTPEERALWK